MKKQNSKKYSDLPLNHYIAVNFRCYFNLVSTIRGTRTPSMLRPNESSNFRISKHYVFTKNLFE